MRQWCKARAVARLKLRANQKIVNARLKLKILSDSRATRSANGKRARARLIIEMRREVELDADTLTEVSDNRSFKSGFGGIVCIDAAVWAKADAATARFTKSGIT